MNELRNKQVKKDVQVPVVQMLDCAIHRINHYPADKYYGNQLRYSVDRDLSTGWRYPCFLNNWGLVVTFSRMVTAKESYLPALRKEQLCATSQILINWFLVPGKKYSSVPLFLLFVTFKTFWIFFRMNQFDCFNHGKECSIWSPNTEFSQATYHDLEFLFI